MWWDWADIEGWLVLNPVDYDGHQSSVFPGAAAVEAAMFPALAEVEAEFAGAGLRQVALDVARIQTVESLTAYVERLRLRAISTFEYLSEEEIEQGFARMDADVAAGTPAFRLAEDGDLLVVSCSRPVPMVPATLAAPG